MQNVTPHCYNLTDKTKRMTQKEKTLAAREEFFKVMHAVNISPADFCIIASTASTWAIENFNEGVDTGREIAKKYSLLPL